MEEYEGDSDALTLPEIVIHNGTEVTVDFEGTEGWTAPASELEPAIGPFGVGDQNCVRARGSRGSATPAFIGGR